jgi:hypothetical protein
LQHLAASLIRQKHGNQVEQNTEERSASAPDAALFRGAGPRGSVRQNRNDVAVRGRF